MARAARLSKLCLMVPNIQMKVRSVKAGVVRTAGTVPNASVSRTKLERKDWRENGAPRGLLHHYEILVDGWISTGICTSRSLNPVRKTLCRIKSRNRNGGVNLSFR